MKSIVTCSRENTCASWEGLDPHQVPGSSLRREEREVTWILLGPVLESRRPTGTCPQEQQNHRLPRNPRSVSGFGFWPGFYCFLPPLHPAPFHLCQNPVETSDFAACPEHGLPTPWVPRLLSSLLGDKLCRERISFSFRFWPQQGAVCLMISNAASEYMNVCADQGSNKGWSFVRKWLATSWLHLGCGSSTLSCAVDVASTQLLSDTFAKAPLLAALTCPHPFMP